MKLSILMILMIGLYSCSLSKHSMTPNKIDEPLTLPKNMYNIDMGIAYQERTNSDYKYFPTGSFIGRGLSDRHTTSIIPYVYNVYSLNKLNYTDKISIKKKTFYSALSGGLEGFGYSERDGYMATLGLGYHTKYIFNDSFYDNVNFNYHYFTKKFDVNSVRNNWDRSQHWIELSYRLGQKVSHGIDVGYSIHTNYNKNRTFDYHGDYRKDIEASEISGFKIDTELTISNWYRIKLFYDHRYLNFFSEGSNYGFSRYGATMRFVF